ncbi:MAG: SGNH/GDSL hydrolase family protein, partial [Roseovarius sp.]|nr:SGNH/GDSL hydrolase family protein [Roseovarius sp.]
MTKRIPHKRHVRIKEFGANMSKEMSPQKEYIELSNGSLEDGIFQINTDQNGFVYNPRFEKGADAPVYVLGDSFVESVFVPEGRRFCDQLSRKMAKTAPRQFLNGGYSGATSLNLLDTLINKIGCQENAAVILILPSNDTLSLRSARGFWDYGSQRYSPILPVTDDAPTPVPLAENIHQLAAVLKVFAHTCSAFSLDLFFATTAFVQSDYEQLPWFKARHKAPGSYEALLVDRRKMNQMMRDVARATRTEIIDLETSMTDPQMFYDDVHLNEAGSQA